jgi:hypothetical protein
MKFLLMISALTCIACARPVSAEVLTNQTIITLTKAGLGPDTVIAKIKSSSNTFDLSTDQLISLKKEGVVDSIIAAMLDASVKATVSANAAVDNNSPNPKVPHTSGIYLLDGAAETAKMTRIDATTSNQSKSSGLLGYAFTMGIAPLQMKTVLPNLSARVNTKTKKPIFYFYFDQANTGLSNGATSTYWLGGGSAVTSPNEFSLVRFESKKDHREVVLAQVNIVGVKSGVMDKARVSFTYKDISTGVFEVTPDKELPPGEYGFVYSASAGASGGFGAYGGGGGSSKIFDFSINN